ncbi:hypothetical protein LQ567_17120 [Niabella pedocola]|uniref:Uncharacterized protein n=1 Tax=Niabella pedocola TaxID=1752077 RepID=A0ABS8PUK9_9BACT|nr:hypothetical protein [Niabella pedocola]MCD2424504.1 hypothetical protein [Niabella pedocola]
MLFIKRLAPFFLAAFFILNTHPAQARLKIPFGNREVLQTAADLPDTDAYLLPDNKHYLDLGVLHEEYNIAYILPLWVTKEPRLVGYDKKSDTFYELTGEQLREILSENKLEEKKLLRLGFYTRYGGKLVGLLLLSLIIYGFLPSKPKTITPQRV